MALKNARLGRAEKLTQETRDKFGLPSKGLVIIESNNPNLQENIVAIDSKGGIREYLLRMGNFKEAPLD